MYDTPPPAERISCANEATGRTGATPRRARRRTHPEVQSGVGVLGFSFGEAIAAPVAEVTRTRARVLLICAHATARCRSRGRR
jgi:hypothetical protein